MTLQEAIEYAKQETRDHGDWSKDDIDCGGPAYTLEAIATILNAVVKWELKHE